MDIVHGAKPDAVDLPGLLALIALSIFLCCIVFLSMPKGGRFPTKAERVEIAAVAARIEQAATEANATASPGYIVEPADPV